MVDERHRNGDTSARPPTNRTVEDITRRRFIVGGTALAALVVGGCGDERDDSADTAGGTEAGTGSRTVAGVLGATYTFDQPPARVFGDLDVLASLGVTPVGSELFESSEWAGYQQAVLDPSTTVVRYTDGPNFEAIAATRPDLILTAFADEAHHEVLADIAPTVFVDNTQPWRDVIRAAAVPLFREVEAERVIGEVELRFEQFRDSHPELDGVIPAALVVDTDGTVTAMTAESSLNAALGEAGFGPLARSGDPYGDAVSNELLTDAAVGDVLVVFIGGWRLSDPGEPVPSAVDELLASPLFSSLPAAQGGTLVFPDEGYRAAYYFTPLYLPTWIDHLDTTFA